MDWGLAKRLRDDRSPETAAAEEASVIATARAGAGDFSKAGEAMGTPAYMAPEQARGEVDQLDERCDVFGLGAILCVLLTGQPPYRGSKEEVDAQAARGDLKDALERLGASGADAQLGRLARACPAPAEEGRRRDAGVVVRAVGAYLTGVQERVREAERQRAAVEARAVEERKRRRLALVLAGAILLLVLGGGGALWWSQQRRATALARQQA